MHSAIPSRISTSKEISNRDIVSQVVYGEVLDMGLATPVSVSCHQGRGERQLNFKCLTFWSFILAGCCEEAEINTPGNNIRGKQTGLIMLTLLPIASLQTFYNSAEAVLPTQQRVQVFTKSDPYSSSTGVISATGCREAAAATLTSQT